MTGTASATLIGLLFVVITLAAWAPGPYIVRGKGTPDRFCLCSHGAGRKMSRGEARRTFRFEDHIRAAERVKCRKDAEVIDETPAAYEDIDAVTQAQTKLMEVVHTPRQLVCVKG
jgi:tRNA-splicing ligase RtcB